MQPAPREIILLKPTSLFLAFLANHLPGNIMPDIELLSIDATAYSLPLHDKEEALVDSLEANFPFMFQYEIKRWLGEDSVFDIKASFLDFLCCFKFEMHSHLILLEPSFETGQQLLCIKPRHLCFEIIDQPSLENTETLDLVRQVHLTHLKENATVIIKNFQLLSDISPFLEQYFLPIVKMEMMRMEIAEVYWPPITSFELFTQYFEVNIHTHVVHLNSIDH